MDAQKRLQELLDGLVADEREGNRDRIPVVGVVDAAILAMGLQIEIDQQVEEREKQAEDAGKVIACKLGCTACCENVVVAYRPEVVVIADWLRLPDNDGMRHRFVGNYPEWRSAMGDALDQFHELQESGENEAADECYHKLRSRHTLCAFNDGGPCLIYPVRPNVCRYTMALDTSDYCAHDNPAGRGPVFLGFPPLDELMKRVQPMLRVAHQRMIGIRGPIALCQAISELLASD